MGYEKLKEVLKSDHNFRGVIKSIHLLKLGCIGYSTEPDSDDILENIVAEKDVDFDNFNPKSIIQNTADTLKKQ